MNNTDIKIDGIDYSAMIAEAVSFFWNKKQKLLSEHRLSEKMCTFAHRYYSFVVETKVTKRADFQARKPALIFIGHKKFYRTPIFYFRPI